MVSKLINCIFFLFFFAATLCCFALAILIDGKEDFWILMAVALFGISLNFLSIVFQDEINEAFLKKIMMLEMKKQDKEIVDNHPHFFPTWQIKEGKN